MSDGVIIFSDSANTGEYFTLTNRLRFEVRTVRVSDGALSTGVKIVARRVLQQMWQGANGTQRWEDVPEVQQDESR